VLLAWVIGSAWQGHGFAKEAVRGLVRCVRERFPSHTLVATIHPHHGASASVARSAGLVATEEIDDGEVVWRAPSGRGMRQRAPKRGMTGNGVSRPRTRRRPMIEDLKEHLRQDHGIHEAPEDVAVTEGDPSAGASYGPGLSTEQLETLHEQHHKENPELLRHSHGTES
jgi:hypothetical protein